MDLEVGGVAKPSRLGARSFLLGEAVLLLLVLEDLRDRLFLHVRNLARFDVADFSDRLFLAQRINQLVQSFELELASSNGDQVVVFGLLILRLN